jgi:hypothetical protein
MTLRVALDLSGTDEPLGNGMALLAMALSERDDTSVVRFHSGRERPGDGEAPLATRGLWRPLWRTGRGRRIDDLLPAVDVVHVGGLATPPTRSCPLVISVDDLRPLRDDTRGRLRTAQLRRAVGNGAQLVATSRAASLEVQRALGLSRENVVVVTPAVAWDADVHDGHNLVVNLTGRTDAFISLSSTLAAMAQRRHAEVVVLASAEAQARLRAVGVVATLRSRRHAATVLSDARVVVHLSDGARFPRFAIASLAAGVPVLATTTQVNRELLDGAAVLADEADQESFVGAIEELWENDSRRAVLRAAGRVRSGDFAPASAAARHRALYDDVVLARSRR